MLFSEIKYIACTSLGIKISLSCKFLRIPLYVCKCLRLVYGIIFWHVWFFFINATLFFIFINATLYTTYFSQRTRKLSVLMWHLIKFRLQFLHLDLKGFFLFLKAFFLFFERFSLFVHFETEIYHNHYPWNGDETTRSQQNIICLTWIWVLVIFLIIRARCGCTWHTRFLIIRWKSTIATSSTEIMCWTGGTTWYMLITCFTHWAIWGWCKSTWTKRTSIVFFARNTIW